MKASSARSLELHFACVQLMLPVGVSCIVVSASHASYASQLADSKAKLVCVPSVNRNA